jgi:hypothetical protein
MNRRVIVFISILLCGVAAMSVVVLRAGISELTLASQKTRKDLELAELSGDSGFVAVLGCMRHDLAVGVRPSGQVYKLGEAAPDFDENGKTDDRVFTPLAARDDCDESKPPVKVYALIENDDALGTTISGVYAQKVAPPPVPAVVSGVIGFGAGHAKMAASARAHYAQRGVIVDGQPLLAKGRGPGPLWVAIVTLLAGAHGLLFCGFAVFWMIRRQRRVRASLAGHVSEEEESFFSSETIE